MASIPASQNPTKVIQTFTVKNSESSYAAMTEKLVCPKRDQGLILDCTGGLSLTEYTCAVGDIVNPKNVLFSSRISNNRVCLYLANKNLVDNITDQHEFIQIGLHKITIRPLVSKNIRIIFSNVHPSIPNNALENILEQLNVKRASPVSILKAAINKEGYSHVASFRRQVYIKPDDLDKVPDIFKINYDDLNYYIYAGTDTLKCFKCNLEGHLARNCTEEASPTSESMTQSVQVHTLNASNSSIPQTNNVNIEVDNILAVPSQLQRDVTLSQGVKPTVTTPFNLKNPENKWGHSQIGSTSSQTSNEEEFQLVELNKRKFKKNEPEVKKNRTEASHNQVERQNNIEENILDKRLSKQRKNPS